MTMYNCRIRFQRDRALGARIARGDFGDPNNPYVPLTNLPAPPGNSCWPALLKSWCRNCGIPCLDEGLVIRAKVKKHQVEAFIEFVYAGSIFSLKDEPKGLR